MDKWKVAVIVVLLASMAGYGWYGANQSSTPPAPEQKSEAAATPDATQQKVQALIGTEPRPWSIGKEFWVNVAQPVEPQDIKGQVTLMEFWRTGCSHCEEAVPFVAKLYADYKSRGVKFVTFQSPGVVADPSNPENNWQAVQQWIGEHKIPYPVAFDQGSKLRSQYGIDLYPMTFIIDRQNRIAHAVTGHTPDKEQEIKQALENALKK